MSEPRPSKKKAVRRPGPRHPRTAFMAFCAAKRQTIVDENPGITFGMIQQRMGAIWRSMPEEDKAPFKQMYADAMKVYHRELMVFRAEQANKKETDSLDSLEV